jgi:hypothetical protein
MFIEAAPADESSTGYRLIKLRVAWLFSTGAALSRRVRNWWTRTRRLAVGGRQRNADRPAIDGRVWTKLACASLKDIATVSCRVWARIAGAWQSNVCKIQRLANWDATKSKLLRRRGHASSRSLRFS